MNYAIYIESKIDGKTYCKTNGHFTRHLRKNNLTYQDYYEKYVSGVSPKCICGQRLTFYQKSETYANSCGSPKCRGKSISNTKQNWTEEQKRKDSKNKKLSASKRSKEQIKEQVEKTKKTFMKKYGVEWISSHPLQKEKSRKTKLRKYGDEKYNNSEKANLSKKNKSIQEKIAINEKRCLTNLERYGVESTLLIKSTVKKINKGNASIKKYELPSGKIIGVRGYEPIVLDILLKTYKESDLIVHDDYSDYAIEVFKYIAANRHHMRYYPDIYIPDENRILEVKSRWWWDGYGEEKYHNRLLNNLAKRQAVIDRGYNYEVWLFDNKYSYRIIKSDKDI